MRILVVVPWAPSVTRPRSLGLIERLAESHEVVVVGAAWSDKEADELRALRVSKVVPVRLKKSRAYLRCLLGLLFSRRSLQQSYVDDQKFRRAIRDEKSIFIPDLSYFNVIRSAQFSNELQGVTRIIDLDEFRSAYYALLAENSNNPLWRLIARVESRRMRQAEMAALADFDKVLVSSPTDLYSEQSKIRLVRSPHAIGVIPAPGHSERIPGSIVFVGRQSYRANAEAVTWFVKEVLPKVLKHFPGAHLTIVGDGPPRSILQLAGPAVSVTGRVENLGEYYAAASVSIIPVRMATGVQMKLIESMVVGTPVVTTPIVAHGAGVDETQCLISDTAEEWASSVVDLLLHPRKGHALASAARHWANETYSRDAIEESMDRVIRELDLIDLPSDLP